MVRAPASGLSTPRRVSRAAPEGTGMKRALRRRSRLSGDAILGGEGKKESEREEERFIGTGELNKAIRFYSSGVRVFRDRGIILRYTRSSELPDIARSNSLCCSSLLKALS